MRTEQDYKDKGISDEEVFKEAIAKQESMPRRYCAVHNQEEFKYESLEHELHATAPAESTRVVGEQED